MPNSFYNQSGYPAYGASGDSQSARSEFSAIQTAFDKLPTLTANGLKFIRVNTAANALEAFSVSANLIPNVAAGNIVATDVQAAINELDTEKGAKASGLNQFASTTSLQLAGVISDETGSGSLVFGTSPTLTGTTVFPAGAAATPSFEFGAGSGDGLYAYFGGIGFAIGGVLHSYIGNDGRSGYSGATVWNIGAGQSIENHAQSVTGTAGAGSTTYGTLLNYSVTQANLVGSFHSLLAQSSFAGPTGTIANYYGVSSNPIVDATNLSTITSVIGFQAANASVNGGTVTTKEGFRCVDLTGATNHYGFRGQLTSGTGKYNLYMSGTADNYLSGDVLIGSATNINGIKLQVTGSMSVTSQILRGIAAATTVGAIEPSTQLWGVNTLQGSSQVIGMSGANTSAPSLYLTKTRGTNPGDFSAVQAGDIIGNLSWMSDDGVDYASMAARIRVVAEATATSNNTPSYIGFSTNPGAATVTEVARLTSGGVLLTKQSAPTAKSTTATLTIAELLTGIITASGTSYTLTLPTGTLTDAGIYSMNADSAFEWSIISTASGTVTLGAGTDHTIVGTATILTGISARFFTRKTAANTFVTYRIA